MSKNFRYTEKALKSQADEKVKDSALPGRKSDANDAEGSGDSSVASSETVTKGFVKPATSQKGGESR